MKPSLGSYHAFEVTVDPRNIQGSIFNMRIYLFSLTYKKKATLKQYATLMFQCVVSCKAKMTFLTGLDTTETRLLMIQDPPLIIPQET